jgi:hypothetical protein
VLPLSLGPQLLHRAGHDVGQVRAAELHLHLSYDRLARADDLLLVPEGSGGVLAAEDIEVRLPDQFIIGTARGVRGDPACADQEEPALQVLEVHALPGSGQQVAHADELELALWLAPRPPLGWQLDPGHRTPEESTR